MIMTSEMPKTLFQYVQMKLAAFSDATRVVLIFDPNGITKDRSYVVDAQGQGWKCIHFQNNVYEVSLEFYRRDPDERTALCITTNGQKNIPTEISFIPNASKAIEETIDASLPAALVLDGQDAKDLWRRLPNTILEPYGELLASNLSLAKAAILEIHQSHPITPLTRKEILYVVIRSLLPHVPLHLLRLEAMREDIPLLELLIHPDVQDNSEAARVIAELAKEVVHSQQHSRILLDVPISELSVTLYAARIIEAAASSVDVHDLRSVGISCIDEGDFAQQLKGLLSALRNYKDLGCKVDQVGAEHAQGNVKAALLRFLCESNIALHKIVDDIPGDVATELIASKLENALGLETMPDWVVEWTSMHPPRAADDATEPLRNTVSLLGSIETRLRVGATQTGDLSELVGTYVNSGDANLEYDFWQADYHIRLLKNTRLLERWKMVRECFRTRIRSHLLEANQRLAGSISNDVRQFMNSDQTVLYVLRNALRRIDAIRPNTQSRVWFVVFDGMRWDLWDKVVRPALTPLFEIEQESPYLALIPSVTKLSRTAMIAGKLPEYWYGTDNRRTSAEHDLGAVSFGFMENHPSDYMFRNRMENQNGIELSNRKGRNILIYNIADDWLHGYQHDPFELARHVEQELRNKILPELEMLIEDGDSVIISSDHGFIELDRSDGQDVEVRAEFTDRGRMTPTEGQISWRYTHAVPADGTIESNVRALRGYENCYSATGHTWFQRPGRRGHSFERYAHGGVSLQEMVVPGVILRRKTSMMMELTWQDPPGFISLEETEEKQLSLNLDYRGVERIQVEFEASDAEVTPKSAELVPGSSANVTIHITGRLDIRNLTVSGAARTRSGTEIEFPSITIVVDVNEREDVVVFDMSALDILDN